MTRTKFSALIFRDYDARLTPLFLRSAYVIGAVAFAVELLMAVVPATAATVDQSRVYIGDLDLTSDVDRVVLNQRVTAAARTVCRSMVNDTIVGRRLCMTDTLAAMRPQIDALVQRKRTTARASNVAGRPVSSR